MFHNRMYSWTMISTAWAKSIDDAVSSIPCPLEYCLDFCSIVIFCFYIKQLVNPWSYGEVWTFSQWLIRLLVWYPLWACNFTGGVPRLYFFRWKCQTSWIPANLHLHIQLSRSYSYIGPAELGVHTVSLWIPVLRFLSRSSVTASKYLSEFLMTRQTGTWAM